MSQYWTDKKLETAAHIAFWVINGVASFLLFSTALTFGDTVLLTTINMAILIALFYLHTHWVNQYIEKGQYKRFFATSITAFTFLTLLRVGLNLLIFKGYVTNDFAVFFGPVFRLVGFLVGTAFIIVIIAVSYQLLKNRYLSQRRNLALINEQQAAQLQLLKAQINPHFLFNALNNVYSLTVAKSDDAPKMLLKLSTLLRYVIYESQEKEVLLEKEVAHLHTFIELFQMRSEDPLSISLKTEGNVNGVKIEPMILMPIVENCFKHTDFDTNPAAFADILLTVTPQSLIFKTKNSFDRSDVQKDAVGGVGLANIKHRLSLRYPSKATLETKESDSIFELILTIHLSDNQ
ncbi:MAG: histidine kinase [Saprospiraceae bacterium]|nr:histidine kinase [Saprospiraceae bacterium]